MGTPAVPQRSVLADTGMAPLPPFARLNESTADRLRCPACGAGLIDAGSQLICSRTACGAHYPIVNGIPVLLGARSLFAVHDFLAGRDTTFRLAPSRAEKIMAALLALLPDISLSIKTRQNYERFRDALLAQSPSPRVLVVGGSIPGHGMDALADPRIELVSTDVSFGPLTSIVCDAHDIPFAGETFDGVVAQAVLEHVLDPQRCVSEIHRVLTPGGLVYAETPFMQQVHMGRYDFTRFTHSGHRRLFRDFSELSSGAVGGPAMALAWSYQYFLLSFARTRLVRGLLRAFAQLTSFYLKYLDYFLIDRPGAIDAASGFFFMGRKEGRAMPDRELPAYYRGAISG